MTENQPHSIFYLFSLQIIIPHTQKKKKKIVKQQLPVKISHKETATAQHTSHSIEHINLSRKVKTGNTVTHVLEPIYIFIFRAHSTREPVSIIRPRNNEQSDLVYSAGLHKNR